MLYFQICSDPTRHIMEHKNECFWKQRQTVATDTENGTHSLMSIHSRYPKRWLRKLIIWIARLQIELIQPNVIRGKRSYDKWWFDHTAQYEKFTWRTTPINCTFHWLKLDVCWCTHSRFKIFYFKQDIVYILSSCNLIWSKSEGGS